MLVCGCCWCDSYLLELVVVCGRLSQRIRLKCPLFCEKLWKCRPFLLNKIFVRKLLVVRALFDDCSCSKQNAKYNADDVVIVTRWLLSSIIPFASSLTCKKSVDHKIYSKGTQEFERKREPGKIYGSQNSCSALVKLYSNGADCLSSSHVKNLFALRWDTLFGTLFSFWNLSHIHILSHTTHCSVDI